MTRDYDDNNNDDNSVTDGDEDDDVEVDIHTDNEQLTGRTSTTIFST